MINKRRSKSHSQGTYYTIMLVPSYSTGRTHSLRISRRIISLTIALTILVLAALGVMYARSRYLGGKMRELGGDLEQSYEDYISLERQSGAEYERLKQQSQRLQELLRQEREKNVPMAEDERMEYEQMLDYYEQQFLEIMDKLQELEKAREEIYNQLSNMKYLPPINIPASTSQTDIVFTNYDSGNSEDLFYILSTLELELNNQLTAYLSLTEEVARLKPYIDNYPTIWPLTGTITSEFGYRGNPFGGPDAESHTGLDIAVPHGTGVRAAGGGVVTFSGEKGAYGLLVIIDHGIGLETYYAHNSELLVKEGDIVKREQLISRAGSTGRSTGPHLHYEVHVNKTPVNPRKFL